jgi:hypothetical protein
MKNQRAMFELEPLETEQQTVWERLSREPREVAMRLLAQLMARSVMDGSKPKRDATRKEGDDDE